MLDPELAQPLDVLEQVGVDVAGIVGHVELLLLY